jgi:hypothetical protein
MGPGGGLSMGPGGGMSMAPGGGLYMGACDNHYKSNWPPIERFLQELKNRNLMDAHRMIAKAHGFG